MPAALGNVKIPTFKMNIETSDSRNSYDDELEYINENIAPPQPSLPSLFGIPLKYISLVTLAIQNSLLTIVMHYSRVSLPASQMYSAATAVLMNEILKGSISLIIAFMRVDLHGASAPVTPLKPIFNTPQARLRKLMREILSSDCWKLSIPAILYVVQNNLQFIAASNLEPSTFQVTYQMKILTTAGFSVLLLRKKLAVYQWMSLLFLAIGVGMVQIQGLTGNTSDYSVQEMDGLKGFSAVAAACFTSGLAGVYFEMVLKNTQADLWVRNVQLAMFSVLPALFPVLVASYTDPTFSMFQNFGVWAWGTVMMQVFGGLVTAMVIQYADNILKGFATSLSIVISFLASVALFSFHLSLSFLLGALIVLGATWAYNQQPNSLELPWIARRWNERWGRSRYPVTDVEGRGQLLFSAEERRSTDMPLSNLSNSHLPHRNTS